MERNFSIVSAINSQVVTIVQKHRWLEILGPLILHVIINAVDIGFDLNQAIKHFRLEHI